MKLSFQNEMIKNITSIMMLEFTKNVSNFDNDDYFDNFYKVIGSVAQIFLNASLSAVNSITSHYIKNDNNTNNEKSREITKIIFKSIVGSIDKITDPEYIYKLEEPIVSKRPNEIP